MIRILHVFMGMNCGGAENMIMNIYRNIDKEKIQFDFLVHNPKKGFFDDEIKQLGGRIFYAPRFRLFNFFEYKKAINSFFDEHNDFAAVHGHLGSSACIYLPCAKKHGMYAIAHSHNTNPNLLIPKNLLYHELNRITRITADYFFACSNDAGVARFGKKIPKKSNFKVLKNAIQLDKYIYDASEKTRILDEFNLHEKFVVGNIGRLNEQKNHMFLLEIFKEILNIKANAVLMIAGDGTLKDDIIKRAKELGIADKMILTGVRSDIPSLLQAMDCFVFPSLYEGLGIVAIEAESFGIPCFINETLPQDLYINKNVYGLSLNASPKEWAEFIIEKGSEKVSCELARENIKEAGYDINETVRMLEEFYLNIK